MTAALWLDFTITILAFLLAPLAVAIYIDVRRHRHDYDKDDRP